jgi:Raf kinase inhibitor-like YbhB/YbcL family protein
MKKAAYVLLALVLATAFVSGCAGDSPDPEEPAANESQDAASGEDPAEENAEAMEFSVTSSAYEDGAMIPVAYCNTGVEGGENVSVPLTWEGAPANTQSFALIMVDRHEVANEWVHWMVVNIPPSTTSLGEGDSGSLPSGAEELLSTNGAEGYQGPQPPAGSGDHEYETIVFALDVASVDVAQDASYAEFLDAMDPHHLAEASISGLFGR